MVKPVVTLIRRCCFIGHPLNVLLPPSQTASAGLFTVPCFLIPHYHRIKQQTLVPHRTYIRKPTQPQARAQALRDYVRPLMDEEITLQTCQYVNEDNKFVGTQSVRNILAGINRSTHHLVWLNHKTYPDAEPICKVMSHADVHAMDIKRRELAAAQIEKGKQAAVAAKKMKELQLSWGISGNDLNHRMKKFKEFLQKGSKVEILLAGKKGMAPVPKAQMEELVESVKTAAESIGGVMYKAMEGQVGKQVVLRYKLQGTGSGKEQDEDEDSDSDSDEDGDGDDGEEKEKQPVKRIIRRR